MSEDAQAPSNDLRDHYAHCEAHVREGDRDGWLAMLFAPAAARPYAHALQAFFLDIRHVRDRVKEPLAGELRLQWWRDALAGEGRGEVGAHPIAAALLDTIATFRLPRELFLELLEAHRFDLYDDPMPSLLEWENYAEQTQAGPLRLLSMVLTGRVEPGGIAAASHAGAALSVVAQLRDLSLQERPVFLPADILSRHKLGPEAVEVATMTPALAETLADMRGIARLHLDALRRHADGIEPAALPAFLPASLVEPTLRYGERRVSDPFRQVTALPRWRRQWILWRASRRGFPRR